MSSSLASRVQRWYIACTVPMGHVIQRERKGGGGFIIPINCSCTILYSSYHISDQALLYTHTHTHTHTHTRYNIDIIFFR